MFLQEEIADHVSSPAEKKDEVTVNLDSTETDEQTPQENQGAIAQVSYVLRGIFLSRKLVLMRHGRKEKKHQLK